MSKNKKKSAKKSNMNAISAKLIEYALWLLIAVSLVSVGIFGTRYCYKLGYQIFDREPRNVAAQELSITIGMDEKVSDVAEALEAAGIIDSALVFRIQGILYDLEIQPGTYIVNTRTSSLELYEQFNEGPVSLK